MGETAESDRDAEGRGTTNQSATEQCQAAQGDTGDRGGKNYQYDREEFGEAGSYQLMRATVEQLKPPVPSGGRRVTTF